LLKAKNAPEELSCRLGENEGQNKESNERLTRFLQPVVALHRIFFRRQNKTARRSGPFAYSVLQEIRI
jgi:hypothetical protein